MGPTYQAIVRNWARLVSQRKRLCVAASLSVMLVAGCAESVNASAAKRARADAEEGPADATDLNKPLTAKALAANPPAAIPIGEATLLGARHDMTLVAERANAACACVKVGLGSAQSAAFAWQSSAPRLNDDIQLAFAMTSESMVCSDEPKGASGASYWGYRISGNDVIVFLEGVRAGRPLTTSAIIPKPVGDGKVYVAPATSKQPYGRPLNGQGERCEIGNVPTKRTTPFTKGELGDSSAKDANFAPTVDVGE